MMTRSRNSLGWRSALGSAALATLVLLTGCSASSGGSGADLTSAGGSPEWLPAVESAESLPADADGAAPNDAASSQQSVIQRGYLSIRVADTLEAVDEASRITLDLGGRIESRHISSDQFTAERSTPSSAHLVLRIPDTRLDEAYDQLSDLGTVRSDERTSEDVTLQKIDLQARVDSLQVSIDRLEALVTDAGDLSDLIELETALADRRSQLDSLTAQRDYLQDQVSFSTISVDVVSIATSPDPDPETFWSAFIAGLKSIGTAVSGVVVGFGFVLPWLIVLGVITAIIVTVVRLANRRKHTD